MASIMKEREKGLEEATTLETLLKPLKPTAIQRVTCHFTKLRAGQFALNVTSGSCVTQRIVMETLFGFFFSNNIIFYLLNAIYDLCTPVYFFNQVISSI